MAWRNQQKASSSGRPWLRLMRVDACTHRGGAWGNRVGAAAPEGPCQQDLARRRWHHARKRTAWRGSGGPTPSTGWLGAAATAPRAHGHSARHRRHHGGGASKLPRPSMTCGATSGARPWCGARRKSAGRVPAMAWGDLRPPVLDAERARHSGHGSVGRPLAVAMARCRR